MSVRCTLSAVVVVVAACNPGDRDSPQNASNGGITLDPTGISGDGVDADADDDANDDDDDDGEKFDVGAATGDPIPCPEGQVCDECVVAEHTPCDDGSTDLFQAIGLNCPGDPQVTGTVDGSPAAIGMRSSFGSTGTWNPREGTKYAVLGSGFVGDLDMPTPNGDLDVQPTHCNDDLGAYDPGGSLPAPLRAVDVVGDCTTDAALLGTGDCSKTIAAQFNQGMAANDYTEMRVVATVPPSNNSLSYDFAFFSTEYPFYFGSAFNDMYVGWLESESWTGNISFDEAGQPISLNAGFLDFKDDGGGGAEMAGTCMSRHAGTKWLSTTAPVTPGEEITLVFAVFDLSDSILDSYVFLDNFQWGCDGTDQPMTQPVG
jgi:hypothetical protein